jgi:hypothetical protein
MLLGLNWLDCPGHGTQGIFGTVGLVVTRIQGVFSPRKFLALATVALSFVLVN